MRGTDGRPEDGGSAHIEAYECVLMAVRSVSVRLLATFCDRLPGEEVEKMVDPGHGQGLAKHVI